MGLQMVLLSRLACFEDRINGKHTDISPLGAIRRERGRLTKCVINYENKIVSLQNKLN
jgi:hypothetical protein